MKKNININKKTKRFVSILKKAALSTIILTASAIVLVEGYFEYSEFSTRAEKFEADYIQSQKTLIKQEVIKVTDYISLKRSQIQLKVKQNITSRVYDAHAIATNIYNKFHDKLPENEVKKLIVEALRPLRFFGGESYYFLHSLDGVSQLHPLRPEIEGKNRIDLQDLNGKYFVRELLDIVKTSGEGFLFYNYRSFKSKDVEKPKITFVKHFKPYNWSIGSGGYLDRIKQQMQQEMLSYIEQIRFGENSYIFVVDYDGVVRMNASQKHLIGKNIWELEDPNGIKVIQEERKAVRNPDGDFIYYVWNKPSTSTPSPKISFMKGVEDWRWMIGSGLYVDDAKIVIQKQRKELKEELIELTVSIILISLLLGLIVILIVNRFSAGVAREIDLFLEFFKNTSIKAEKINIDSLHYTELKELAISANKMLDKQIETETNRSKTEKSLRASETRLNEAQRITHFGSWEYTAATDKLLWSNEVYQILELDPDKDKPNYGLFVNLIHPDDRELTDTTYKNSLKNKVPFSLEHRLKLTSGRIKIVRDHAEAKYNDLGEVISSAGTMQDITELREKEELIKRTQKMDALGKLTGGIAHDYNNMLGVILGYSEMVLNDSSLSPKTNEYVTQIYDAGLRAKTLTSKLMGFTRNRPSRLDIVDINTELLNSNNLYEKTLTARIKLKFDLCADVGKVELDLGDFNDAIINIVINASHAITANGSVTITTRNITLNRKEADILNLESGEYISLSISDTGSGMDANTLNRIFDPFFTTKSEKGTGLGLSQVYGFVKRTGGTISVDSELDTGTEFILYFPRHYSETVRVEEAPASITIKKGFETILIVDDEESLCDMARDILSAQGYHIFVASSAKQALLLLEVEKVDILFSDIIMPGINGYELADEVTKKYPHIKIQLASGFNDAMNIENETDISDFNVLQKPYSANDLLISIQNLTT